MYFDKRKSNVTDVKSNILTSIGHNDKLRELPRFDNVSPRYFIISGTHDIVLYRDILYQIICIGVSYPLHDEQKRLS